MVNGISSLERLESDVGVGVLSDGALRCRVSVRGGRNIILAFAGPNDRVLEVVFSPRAARQLVDIIGAAAKLGEGR